MSREAYDEGYAAGLADNEEKVNDLEEQITHLKEEAAEAQEARDEADRSLLAYLDRIGEILADIRREFGR